MPNHTRAGHLSATHIGNHVTINSVTGRIHDVEHRTSLFGGAPICIINLRLPDGTSHRSKLDPADPITLVDPAEPRDTVPADAPLMRLIDILDQRAAMWAKTGDQARDERRIALLDEARTSEAECRFLILELTQPTHPKGTPMTDNTPDATEHPKPATVRPASPRCESGGHDNCTCDICY